RPRAIHNGPRSILPPWRRYTADGLGAIAPSRAVFPRNGDEPPPCAPPDEFIFFGLARRTPSPNKFVLSVITEKVALQALGDTGTDVGEGLTAVRNHHQLGRAALADADLGLEQPFPFGPGTAMLCLERLEVLTGGDVVLLCLIGGLIAPGNVGLDRPDQVLLVSHRICFI